jgi:glycosyltransferase involved in cell wall biosynthesis
MSGSETPAAGIDIPPPTSLAVGKGTAFVIAGWCYHPRQPTRALSIQIGDSRQRVEQFRLPRQDVYERLGDDDPARAQAFRSGFAAVVDVPPVDRERTLELAAVITLDGGREVSVPLASIAAAPGLPIPPEAADAGFPGPAGRRVAICMATYNPPAELLERQLDSIRGQTHDNWVCLISDDDSEPEGLERLTSAVEGDPRFVISRGPRRLGFYGNFERAMSMVPESADFVTLCDQDDCWYPEKLARLLAAIGDSQLAYSDARVVSPKGEVILPSYWTVRSTNFTNFGSLLLANTITGAASLFRRELLDDALPLPPRFGNNFHDHWLGLVAMAHGRVEYVDAPLYDYTQHEGAVIGHTEANKPHRSFRTHLLERLRNPGDGSRIAYYYKWHQHLLFDEILRLRCWDVMSASKRRTLRRLLDADRGVAGIGWLLGRRARRLWGRDETLDRELSFAYALLRRRGVSALTAGRDRPSRVLARDASVPPAPPTY